MSLFLDEFSYGLLQYSLLVPSEYSYCEDEPDMMCVAIRLSCTWKFSGSIKKYEHTVNFFARILINPDEGGS